jgi:multiple sugar transport system permease protein
VNERGAQLIERPEYEHATLNRAVTGDAARPLSLAARLADMDPVCKFTVLLAAIVIWEVYTRGAKVPALIFPSFDESIAALWSGLVDYDLAPFFSAESRFEQPTALIAAASVVVTVPVVAVVVAFQRRIVAGLSSGAVKG